MFDFLWKKHFFAKFWLKKLSSSAWRLRGSAGRLRATTWHKKRCCTPPSLSFQFQKFGRTCSGVGSILEFSRQTRRWWFTETLTKLRGTRPAQLRGTVPRPIARDGAAPCHSVPQTHLNLWHLKRHPIMSPFGKANIWKSWMHAHGGSRTCTRMKSKKTNNQPPKTKRTWTSKSQNVRIHVFAAKKKANFGMLEQSCVR